MILLNEEDLFNEMGIDINSGENLNEMAKVYWNNDENISLAINPDNNRNLQDKMYFKVYNHAVYKKSN